MGISIKTRFFQTRTQPILNPYFTHTNPYFFNGFEPPQVYLIFVDVFQNGIVLVL